MGGQRHRAGVLRRRRRGGEVAQQLHACVERIDSHRHPVHPQLGHALGERAQSAPFLGVQRHRQVRSIAENLRYRTGQDGARAVLDEDANAVLPRLQHGGGKVDRLDRLPGDRLGRSSFRRRVGPITGIGIKTHARNLIGFAGVDASPGVGERRHRTAVDHHVQTQWHRLCTGDRVDHPSARRSVTADHTIVGRLHDGHVSARFALQRRFDRRSGCGDAPILPRCRLVIAESPVRGRDRALTGQLIAIHARRFDLVEHRLEVTPHPERHHGVGLTGGQADCRLRCEAENSAGELRVRLTDHRAAGELGARIQRGDIGAVHGLGEVADAGEPIGEGVADLGPRQQQIPTGTGIGRRRTGERERQLAGDRVIGEHDAGARGHLAALQPIHR